MNSKKWLLIYKVSAPIFLRYSFPLEEEMKLYPLRFLILTFWISIPVPTDFLTKPLKIMILLSFKKIVLTGIYLLSNSSHLTRRLISLSSLIKECAKIVMWICEFWEWDFSHTKKSQNPFQIWVETLFLKCSYLFVLFVLAQILTLYHLLWWSTNKVVSDGRDLSLILVMTGLFLLNS